MQQLLNFFYSDKSILKCIYDNSHYNSNYETHYIKVDSEHPNIKYLYYKSFQKGISNPFNELKFAGIFCFNKNLLVYEDYPLEKIKDEPLDFTGLTLKRISDVQREVIETVQNHIQKLIPFDSEKISDGVELSSYKEEEAKREAYERYIFDQPSDKNYYTRLYTAQLEHEDYPLFLQYLLGNDQAIQKETECFIEENQDGLARRLKYTKTVIAELDRLNQTNEYIERKKIFHSVNKDMKTINIKVRKDEKELEFKITNSLSTKRDYISTYHIVRTTDRSKYESLFGRFADIHLDDIIEIHYGRKTLYQRELITT